MGAASRLLVEPGDLRGGFDWWLIPGNPCHIAEPPPTVLPPPGTWKIENAPNEVVRLAKVSVWDAGGVNYLEQLYLIGFEERGMHSRKNCSVWKQNLS